MVCTGQTSSQNSRYLRHRLSRVKLGRLSGDDVMAVILDTSDFCFRMLGFVPLYCERWIQKEVLLVLYSSESYVLSVSFVSNICPQQDMTAKQ